ncbi:MAG TPA: DUF4838 domain-containing protein [Tepidisphaeraceae bacterium]|jgi:hypothetical protein
MGRKHVVQVVAYIVGIVALVLPARAEWKNFLAPKGEPAGAFVMVKEGKAQCPIVIPAQATAQEKSAAKELAHWVKEMTGADVPVERTTTGKSVRIVTETALGEEGIRIDMNGDDLVLAGGTTRGVVNAVYALLEEDLGCRFYTNESVRLPKVATLEIRPVARKYVPQLRLRDPYYQFAFDATWSMRNRTNGPEARVAEEMGGHIDYGGLFVHTQGDLLPPDKYFKEHPEYFMLDKAGKRQPWQLCPTEPAVIKVATEKVLERLKTNPHAEIISVSKNDSAGDQVCQCERCKKLRDAEASEMATQLVLVNGVAEHIEKDYPNVVIDTLAYLDTIPVPKTVRPRKNVVVRLCNDTVGSWATPFKPAAQCPVAKITSDWAKACNRLYIWDYQVNFSHYLAPMPNVAVMAENIRFWVKNHAEGVMLQAGYQGVTERDELKSWVGSKLLWDPSRDEKALVADFIEGHYGKSGSAIAEYDALLNKALADHATEMQSPPGGIRYPMDAAFLTKDFLEQASSSFSRAKELAKDDPAVLKRVERAELPILYVLCRRGMTTQGRTRREVVEAFERIGKQEKVQNLEEGAASFDSFVAELKKGLPKEEPKPATQAAKYKVISKGKEAHSYQAFPDACRLSNGDILCVFYAGYGHVSLEADDFPNGGRICMVRSSDEGMTWTEPAVLFDDADDNRDAHIAQLSDGSLVCTFFSWKHKGKRFGSYREFDWKKFSQICENTGAQMVRSTDEGKTWEKAAQSVAKNWYCSAPVRQMPNGKCLLGLYGGKDDNHNFGGVAESDDLCKTWKPVVRIPQPEKISLDAETDLIRLNDGKLFAALRSSKENMHFSTSSDEGTTWSKAQDIGFKGHCPHLTRLSTGEIVLSHRVPHTSIHVSRDECKTWQGPYEIDSCIGAYPATVELKDGSVLIVYYSEGEGSEIRAKRFRLKADGIEMLALER